VYVLTVHTLYIEVHTLYIEVHTLYIEVHTLYIDSIQNSGNPRLVMTFKDCLDFKQPIFENLSL
jgi:hypothetical protein